MPPTAAFNLDYLTSYSFSNYKMDVNLPNQCQLELHSDSDDSDSVDMEIISSDAASRVKAGKEDDEQKGAGGPKKGEGSLHPSASTSSSQGCGRKDDSKNDNDLAPSSVVLMEFDEFESDDNMKVAQKFELELYLDEPRVDRNVRIDMLTYWKAHQYKYPLLVKMARDVLTVPVTTVASESAFSIGSRVVDQFRSSLSPELVEALICSRDWLYGEPLVEEKVNLEDVIEDIMNLHITREEALSVEASNQSNAGAD